ncbi:MAG: serine/threonine-protein kinase, partial [Aureliella sp.]
MADKLDRQPGRILQTSNTLGIDDLSTQPSSVDNRVDAKLPIEFGRYRLLKQLGEGGMGVVYLAHDIELDRKVALKLPHLSGTTAKAFAERFRREARLAATLDHRNICRIYDIGEYQGRQFLTMKFVEGKSLHEIIRSKGAIDPRTGVALLQRIAQAVHFAHERGVIHRDLKPANIMVKKNRDFVIMDFGLARRADQEEAQLTATGAVLGTPAYMAPEQLCGEKGTNGAQSDVYSLGIILYELLTGQRPFQGTAPQIYAQVLISDSVSPASVRDGIEPALDAICQKATHKEVGQRYRSAEEFASVLGQFLNTSIVNGPAPETAHSQQPKPESAPKSLASLPPRGRTSKMLIALGGAAFALIAL